MFYVIYDTATEQYLNELGTFGAYDNAAQYDYSGAREQADMLADSDCRVVGPCIEGETP